MFSEFVNPKFIHFNLSKAGKLQLTEKSRLVAFFGSPCSLRVGISWIEKSFISRSLNWLRVTADFVLTRIFRHYLSL